MSLKMYADEQILDEDFRKRVIAEITTGENVWRRDEALRRHELYRDDTAKWVRRALSSEGLKGSTVEAILNRTPSIAITRKVINKLARTYSNGVTRTTDIEATTEKVEDLATLLDFDERMRTADRYRELQKNTLLQVVPQIAGGMLEDPIYKLVMRALSPFEYDVIEDCYDREQMRCVILSDFIEQEQNEAGLTSAEAGRHPSSSGASTDRRDAAIADAPSDSGMGRKRIFIWWTASYHFTTDDKGAIITSASPDENINPIAQLPFVNNAEGQDGQFWARGGSDLPDSHIIVNKMIGDMNYIAWIQGFGQLVITGRNIKDRVETGPQHIITLDYTADDPKPEVYIVNANPPLDSWMRMIEQHVAMLLTTNDLSAGHVASSLSANNFPSGIATLIEQSEATRAVEDKHGVYVSIERKLWQIIGAWQNLLTSKGELTEEFAEVGALPEDLIVNVRFNTAKLVVTDKERLETLKLRKELSTVDQVDIMMSDNPGMSRDEAAIKVESIKASTSAGVEILNGAQVQSMLLVLSSVATGVLPVESARVALIQSFGFNEELAAAILAPIKPGSVTPEQVKAAGGT